MLRGDTETALGAAVGEIQGGCIYRHPAGECHDIGKGDIRVIGNAAFAGAARGVVLDAVAHVVLNRAVGSWRYPRSCSETQCHQGRVAPGGTGIDTDDALGQHAEQWIGQCPLVERV